MQAVRENPVFKHPFVESDYVHEINGAQIDHCFAYVVDVDGVEGLDYAAGDGVLLFIPSMYKAEVTAPRPDAA